MLWLSSFNEIFSLLEIRVEDFLKHLLSLPTVYREWFGKKKVSTDQFQAFELGYLSRLTHWVII